MRSDIEKGPPAGFPFLWLFWECFLQRRCMTSGEGEILFYFAIPNYDS